MDKLTISDWMHICKALCLYKVVNIHVFNSEARDNINRIYQYASSQAKGKQNDD